MTTLLVDYNNLVMQKAFSKDVEIHSDFPNYILWEFYVFETIYDFIKKFKADEVVIARDNGQYWRKKYFPRYKEKRADTKDKEVDWDNFNVHSNKMFEDLHTYFPFKCLDIKWCEGDDIIGHLARVLEKDIIILSSDQDFKQSLKENVRLYSLRNDTWITCSDTERYLEENIFTGQAKDGILNIITPEDWPKDLRKPGFGKVLLEKWRSTGFDIMLNKVVSYKKKKYTGSVLPADRLKKNKILMDFRMIPKTLTNEIEKCYNEYKLAEIGNLYNYFNSKGWTRFINEFDIVENTLIKFY